MRYLVHENPAEKVVTYRMTLCDCALVVTSLCTGMRCTELARITPRDILMSSGKVRDAVQLRAEITKGCKARLSYFTNPKLIAALDRFASTLLAKGVSSEDVSRLLGHSEIDVTGDYLACSESMLEAAFADVL